MNKRLEDVLELSIDKLKSLIDTSIVMGERLVYNNTTIIPVSKVKCSFITGGVDQKKEKTDDKNNFAGGSGGNMTLTPVAFLVITENDVKVLLLDEKTHLLENLIDLIPEGFEQLASLISKKKKNF